MTTSDFRRWLEGLAEAEATVPARVVLERLPDGGDQDTEPAGIADLTVEELADQFGRTPACVRLWCREGRLPGAYRLRGREWRVPHAAVQAFRDAEAAGRRPGPTKRGRGQAADLGAWRKDGAA